MTRKPRALTAASFLLCRKKGIDLHFLPQRVSRGWNASACAAGRPCGSARVYGLLTGAVRRRTGNWSSSLLLHAALNTLLG